MGYISPICPEAPHGGIYTKFGIYVELVYIINCDKILAID